MAGWGEVLPDIILCSLYIIQLVRLATARDDIFKRPFYIFFIVTGASISRYFTKRSSSRAENFLGIYSVFTVIGYQVAAQFPYSDRYWTIVFFKPAFVRFRIVHFILFPIIFAGAKRVRGTGRHLWQSDDRSSSLLRVATSGFQRNSWQYIVNLSLSVTFRNGQGDWFGKLSGWNACYRPYRPHRSGRPLTFTTARMAWTT